MTIADSLRGGIDGIVIDAVGTLIEPIPSVADVYRAAADDQGITLDPDEVRTRFAHAFQTEETADQTEHLATHEARESARWRRIVAGVLPEVPDPDRAFALLWDHFSRPDAWRCYPDVAPALQLFRQANLAVCIGSNFDARLRSVLAGLPEFDEPLRSRVVISSEVGFRKPHPAFFEAASRQLARDPARLLSVGDDLENDVLGARRAGFVGVLLDRRGRAEPGVPRVASLIELAHGLLANRVAS
ncbi:MAG: HAD family hydrolase [Isosphaeraceae bacterium]